MYIYRHYASAERVCDVNLGFGMVSSFDQCLISFSPYTGYAQGCHPFTGHKDASLYASEAFLETG